MKNWNGKPYHSFDSMLKERFHGKVYKAALNGGMTCPNRDGTLGTAAVFSAVLAVPGTLQGTGEIPLPSR